MGKNHAQFLEACRQGDLHIIKKLCHVNNGKVSSLLRNDSMHFLSKKDPSTGQTGLHCAALNGQAKVVHFLLSLDSRLMHAEDAQGCLPLHLACWNGHVECAKACNTGADILKILALDLEHMMVVP
uniref:Uncharacterized protein n=1 Tax=Romanomermis culicivorax TaxID=13658 RepID=A0A915L9E2_ROMCU